MKSTIEVKTQSTTGKDWKPFENKGAVCLRIDYDGTEEAKIFVDSYSGSGAPYKNREKALINIYDKSGKPVFCGTMEQLTNKLEGK